MQRKVRIESQCKGWIDDAQEIFGKARWKTEVRRIKRSSVEHGRIRSRGWRSATSGSTLPRNSEPPEARQERAVTVRTKTIVLFAHRKQVKSRFRERNGEASPLHSPTATVGRICLNFVGITSLVGPLLMTVITDCQWITFINDEWGYAK